MAARIGSAALCAAVLAFALAGLTAAAPPGRMMQQPPAKQTQAAASLPAIPAADAAGSTPVLMTPPTTVNLTRRNLLRLRVVDIASLASPPPTPAAPPAQCTCDTATYAELRTANASFMNTSGDPRLLNATTNTAWSSLYITPNLVLPNNTQDYVFFQAQIRFSHPVQYINSAQIRLYTNALTSVLQSIAPQLADIAAPTCTGGYVQPPPPFSPESDATITAVYEAPDCRSLYIRGYAPLLDPLATNATQLVVDVSAASVVDACGERFPGTSFTTSVRSRQVAELYALGLAYTPRLGPATDKAATKLAAVFTQPVPGIRSEFFAVTGPKRYSVGRVRLLPGSQSYYAFTVTVSEGYYGTVNVTMTPDAAQQVLHQNTTLPFVSFQKLAVQC